MKRSITINEVPTVSTIAVSRPFYDYEKQAWVIGGLYQRCNHPATMDCNCYGRKHAGELYDPEDLTQDQHKAMAQWTGRIK